MVRSLEEIQAGMTDEQIADAARGIDVNGKPMHGHATGCAHRIGGECDCGEARDEATDALLDEIEEEGHVDLICQRQPVGRHYDPAGQDSWEEIEMVEAKSSDPLFDEHLAQVEKVAGVHRQANEPTVKDRMQKILDLTQYAAGRTQSELYDRLYEIRQLVEGLLAE